MQGLVAIAGFIGDPAERPAIGHAHGERLAAVWHARGIERRAREYHAQSGEQRFLGRPIEIARHEAKAWKRTRSGHAGIVLRRCTLSNGGCASAVPGRAASPRPLRGTAPWGLTRGS